MEALKSGTDVLFILLGGIMVLAMHSGFAFLELGTVRKKSQVNALVKILTDFSVSTIAYFFIGYSLAYGINFFSGAETLLQKNGFELTRFFFLLTFAAAIPAIVSGGIAERARFYPQLAATFLIVGFIYPFFEGIAWNQAYGIQARSATSESTKAMRLLMSGLLQCGASRCAAARRPTAGRLPTSTQIFCASADTELIPTPVFHRRKPAAPAGPSTPGTATSQQSERWRQPCHRW